MQPITLQDHFGRRWTIGPEDPVPLGLVQCGRAERLFRAFAAYDYDKWKWMEAGRKGPPPRLPEPEPVHP